MPRTLLLHLLENYHPKAAEEITFKKDMIAFIKSHPNCFERSCLEGHITGSSWLLNKDHSKALLMHHVKLNNWFQLGGHCDGDADVLAVAIKESQEESGIHNIQAISPEIFDIDVHLIPAKGAIPAHYHYDVRFLLHVTSNATEVKNSESHELRWIDKNPEHLPTQSRSVTRMFDKWLKLT